MHHPATRRLVALLFVAFVALGARAQQGVDLSKLDPAFHAVVSTPGAFKAGTPAFGAALRPALRADGTVVYPAVVRTGDVARLRAEGIELNAVFGDVATVRASAEELARMTALAGVRYVEAERLFYPVDDVVTGVTGAALLQQGFINNTTYTGSGVAVCGMKAELGSPRSTVASAA